MALSGSIGRSAPWPGRAVSQSVTGYKLGKPAIWWGHSQVGRTHREVGEPSRVDDGTGVARGEELGQDSKPRKDPKEPGVVIGHIHQSQGAPAEKGQQLDLVAL